MFDLEYKGGNSVLITTKDRQLLIDGNVTSLGLKMPKLTNAVYLATEDHFSPAQDRDGETLVLSGPGAYEAGPFAIRGTAAIGALDSETDPRPSTIYRIEVGETNIGVIGNIAPNLSDDQLEALGVLDLLIIPVGGNGYTLDASDAVKLVRQIEPKVVIPIHYEEAGIKYEVPQESVDRFVSELAAPVEKMPKLRVKNATAFPATLTIYQLERV